MTGSDHWCNAFYFPHGRDEFRGMFCRLEPGHDGDHWCKHQDETDAEFDTERSTVDSAGLQAKLNELMRQRHDGEIDNGTYAQAMMQLVTSSQE